MLRPCIRRTRNSARHRLGDRGFPPPPEDAYSFVTMDTKKPLHEYYSRCLYYTYHWMTPIIRLIKKQGAIYPRDIYILPRNMRVSEVSRRFEDAWNRAAARDVASKKKHNRNLVFICLSAYKKDMLVVLLLIPIYTFLGLAPSIALNHLTSILSSKNIMRLSTGFLMANNREPSFIYLLRELFSSAFPWILMVFLSQIGLAFLLNITMLKAFQVNNMASQALSDLLYRKVLTLSELSRSSSITGSIINFIFTDNTKITNFITFIPMFLSVPFRLIYSIIILTTTINPRGIGGVLGALISFPLMVLFVRRQLVFTKHYMCYKDIRVKRVTEILMGIRIIKYFSMENIQSVRLRNSREHELLYLIKGKMNSAYMSMIMSTSGPLMLTIAFIILSTTGYLDNATAYSTALVFNTLNIVFNQIPQLFSNLFESLISSDRIIAFFGLPDVDGKEFCLQSLEYLRCVKDNVIEDDENNSYLDELKSENTVVATIGKPSYSWGQTKHLSIPIILDPYFKQTQEAIKKFRKQLPHIQKELTRTLSLLKTDVICTKPRVDSSAIDSEIGLISECKGESNDTVDDFQSPENEEFDTLFKPVTTSCVYLDKWCKDCDLTPFSMIDQISYYKETNYLPLCNDPLIIASKRLYIHAAIMLFFLTDKRFENYRKTIKEAREIVLTKNDFPNVLKDLELKVTRGSLVGIHGRVGSGKSSLLLAILGELANTSSTQQARIWLNGKAAYCPQFPIIFSGTVRSNIVFFNTYDEEKLKKAVSICSLEADLALLSHGLDTEIGERGITLSGGQKARIALARAVYSGADVYLLDDPLSAVDAHVSNSIWNNCILGYLVRDLQKTVIVVSHQVRFFTDCDQVYEVIDGSLVSVPAETIRSQNPSSSLMSIATKDALQEAGGNVGEIKRVDSIIQKASRLVEDEKHAAIGRVQFHVYWEWIKAGGLGMFLLYLVLMLIGNGISQYLGIYVTHWSLDLYHFSASGYILFYIAISIAYILTIFLGRIVFIKASITTTRTLHLRMVDSLLKTKLLFFEMNPLGRILNRLSRDTDQCDSAVPSSILPLVDDLLYLFATLITIMFLSLPSIIFIFPLGILYTFIFNTFRLIAPQLKRVIPILSSPIFALVQESLTSLPSIRCYANEDRLIELNRLNLTRSYSADWLMRAMNRWLSFRVNVTMGAFAVFMSISVVFIAPIGNSSQYTGVVLMSSFLLINRLVMFAFSINSLESSMSSVERIFEYCKLESEEKGIYSKTSVPSTRGRISVASLSLRYRKDLDLVLKDVAFTASRGERIGVVGRTGAGKSSITTALFRLVEPEPDTQIVIDGVDIINVPLNKARQQLAIIPQDPFLFSGTVRTCLCSYSQLTAEGVSPKDISSGVEKIPDEKLWRVLEQVRMREYFEKQPGGLDAKITANGDNLSAGQRQLICVARALLRDAPVVILDEATAQVDRESDSIIQATIRNVLTDRVVIAIAHRLNTIIDFDRIMVVDAGEVREFDTPKALLSNPDSLFSKLVAECADAEDLYQRAQETKQ